MTFMPRALVCLINAPCTHVLIKDITTVMNDQFINNMPVCYLCPGRHPGGEGGGGGGMFVHPGVRKFR